MSGVGDEYLFVAFDPQVNQHAVLDIRPHDGQTHSYLKDVCHKMAQAVKGFHELTTAGPCPGWAVWKIVEWSQKNVPGQERFCAWVGEVLAGYIWMRREFRSPHDGSEIIYIDLMAATPSNIQTTIWNRRLSHVGIALLAFAVRRGVQAGYDGRFGLHAADNDATGWYRQLSTLRSNGLFLPELQGVRGFPATAERALARPYFETTAAGALQLLEDYRNA